MASPSQKKGIPYVRLGQSGLKVSKIVLGCASYGTPEWQSWVLEEEESIKIIKAAYDAGINSFDTANVYSHGQSEIVLGKAIKQFDFPRGEIVVMSKVFLPVRRGFEKPIILPNPDELGYVNQHGLSRKHIFDSVKASLGRLQLDYIDLLQCHRFDYNTPIEETMRALHDVVKAGYVRYIGMSSCWAWQFHATQNYAIMHNLTPFISMQNLYNLLYREEEREMFPTLKHFGVGSMPWSPLAGGLIARPLGVETIRSGSNTSSTDMEHPDVVSAIIGRVEEIAKKRNITMAQVGLAWVLSNEGVSAPIIGVSSVERLQDAISKPTVTILDAGLMVAEDSLDVKLTDEEIQYLKEPYRPRALHRHK